MQVGGGGRRVDLSFITATSDKILEGYIGCDQDGNQVEGAMKNRNAQNRSLGPKDSYTIPAGYHNGKGKITTNISSIITPTMPPDPWFTLPGSPNRYGHEVSLDYNISELSEIIIQSIDAVDGYGVRVEMMDKYMSLRPELPIKISGSFRDYDVNMTIEIHRENGILFDFTIDNIQSSNTVYFNFTPRMVYVFK